MNNKEINEYNKEVNKIADQLNVEFESYKVEVLNYDLENTDIRHDGVHPNLHQKNKMVATLRNHSETECLKLLNKRGLFGTNSTKAQKSFYTHERRMK